MYITTSIKVPINSAKISLASGDFKRKCLEAIFRPGTNVCQSVLIMFVTYGGSRMDRGVISLCYRSRYISFLTVERVNMLLYIQSRSKLVVKV